MRTIKLGTVLAVQGSKSGVNIDTKTEKGMVVFSRSCLWMIFTGRSHAAETPSF